MKLVKEQLPLLLVILASIVAGWALLHPGIPPTHDGEYHVIRFYEFDKMIRAGTIYPRWAPDLLFGYGLPLFTYVYPLPNYMASIFHFFGSSFIDALKLNMFAATVIGSIFIYLWIKELWGKWAGLTSSIFYTFAPYHFVDIYVRGSVGEVWAIGLFPVFLYFYTKFTRTKNVFFFLCSTISLGFIIFSHNILALMFMPFAISYMTLLIVQTKQKKDLLLSTCSILLVSLGLTAVFWLPALLETKYVQGLQIYNINQNFADIFELLFPSWGTGFFDGNLGDQMSVQIGAANLLVVLVSVFFLKKFWKEKEKRNVVFFSYGWLTLLVFLMLPFSKVLWTTLPLIHYFQFPWRLLSLTILVCAVIAGSVVKGKWSALFLSTLVVATTISYAHPVFYHMRTDTYYTSRSNFIDGSNSPGNSFNTVWGPSPKEHAKQPFTIQKGQGSTIAQRITPTSYQVSVSAQTPVTVQANISYFPGWLVEDRKQHIALQEVNGIMTFHLERGIHILTLELLPTTVERIASSISLISLCAVVLIGAFYFKKSFLSE